MSAAHAAQASPTAPDAPLAEGWRLCRRGLAVATAFGLFINLLALTLPLYMMQLFDRVLASRSVETLVMLSIVAAGLLLAHAALSFIRQGVMTRVGAQIESRLTEPVLDAALRARSERGVASQAARDVSELRAAAASPALQSVFDIPWTPLFLIVIVLLDVTLGVVAGFGALLLIALATANAFLARDAQMKATRLSIRALTRLDSYIASSDAVMAMGMTRDVRRRWRAGQEEILDFQQRVGDAQAAFQNLTRFLRMALQAAMLAVGAWLVIEQAVTPGAMLAASIIMARALAPIEQAIGGWRQLETAWAAYRRIKDLLLRAPRPDHVTALPEPQGRLAIEQLAFAPPGGDRPIIKGVSLAIEPGETLGLVGPSGAGKSTLARLIVGAHRPTLGSVRLDGADVYAWDENERGRHVGYMPQDPFFVAGSIRDNIARLRADRAPAEIDAAVVEAARMAGAHEMILKLPDGYDTVIAEPDSVRLSGGQRQRLSFARALFGRPRLLVLDEPTVHLDPPGEQALARALSLARRGGTTIILITHRISLVTRADRVAVVRDGRIERVGPPAEVARSLGVVPQPAAPATPAKGAA